MSQAKTQPIRCAIYTRKSSDEGLEQEFNSLDAQREACEAYIRSQAHEGWRLLPNHFDDGGHSGGTLERPALQELLGLIKSRQLNVIVIYKIDRLTRSLADFARLAELFDQYGVSFVSVTQQFNTTTSMGRLMLNVLLSFAQFERELTGERIRDKIAASKKKGMWMGGVTPLGYDVKDRTLVINEPEAKIVRSLFGLYLDLGSVNAVCDAATARGYRTKARTSTSGRQSGGKAFFPGHIHCILKNPVYAGQIGHKEQVYPGQHPRIIDETIWATVQQKLADNRAGERRRRSNHKDRNPLTGILFDQSGACLTSTHTLKDGKRYRYYAASPSTIKLPGKRARRLRLPADEIESLVCATIGDLVTSRDALSEALGQPISARELPRILENARRLKASLSAPDQETWQRLRPVLQRIIWNEGQLRLTLDRSALAQLVGLTAPTAGSYDLLVKAAINFRGQRMKLAVSGQAKPAQGDMALIKTLARGHDWHQKIICGEITSIKQISQMYELTSSYVRRVLRLAFLAPDVIEAIVNANQPLTRVSRDLMVGERLDLNWEVHRALLFRTQ